MDETESRIRDLMELNTPDLADLVVEDMRRRNERSFYETSAVLVNRPLEDVLSALISLIVDYMSAWGDQELPATDALGEPTLRDVIERIAAGDLAGIMKLSGMNPPVAITKLIATAAALKRD